MARLPPLNALRAFEAAARHNGFIGAAEELHVTRGAISRHVKLLEDSLGVQLFARQAQGVRLTQAGRQLTPVLTEAFGMIARGTERVASDASELRVICPPGTSIRWLLPKLDEFRKAYPDIKLRLTTDFHPDSGFDPIDADIGFSVSNWPNRSQEIEHLTLFPICLTPACSPGYLEATSLERAEDLTRCELLHETRDHADWTTWVNAFQPKDVDPRTGQDFPNLDIATKAAVMGVGVVMAHLVLCHEELASGTLVTPFPDMVCHSPLGGVCLLGGRDKWTSPKVEAFKSWAYRASEADRRRMAHRSQD
ncbi:LysR substrate-binding domain-containing protein [Aestuariicoccus sp. MJ-SS9]|uniref:LysR substrate-binding domain-containing protein n=1 Tax=Aestuariicoccus sp. MJ-SS9 TaxID=3079855 RepID=UPI0029133AA3|nr:LysR substrate-binding domain-containing protein [Aestuariicoccus sp. MJ-SS9]MDU8912331.1 LysR substrate-binding domain-containing protein [Aestuariicoccus sp. MJ-SS9]